MPIRASRPGAGHLSGFFPSSKLERSVAFESTLERDLIVLLEFLPGVLSYEEQPLTLEYGHAGKTRRYTPDFKAVTHLGTLLLECKPASQVSDPQNTPKFAAARKFCQRCGWRFGVVTEADLRSGFLLHNVGHLSYYARFLPPPFLTRDITWRLEGGGAPLVDLWTAFPGFLMSVVQPTLLHLAYHHHIKVPLEAAPLHPCLIATLPNKEAPDVWPSFLPW